MKSINSLKVIMSKSSCSFLCISTMLLDGNFQKPKTRFMYGVFERSYDEVNKLQLLIRFFLADDLNLLSTEKVNGTRKNYC